MLVSQKQVILHPGNKPVIVSSSSSSSLNLKAKTAIKPRRTRPVGIRRIRMKAEKRKPIKVKTARTNLIKAEWIHSKPSKSKRQRRRRKPLEESKCFQKLFVLQLLLRRPRCLRPRDDVVALPLPAPSLVSTCLLQSQIPVSLAPKRSNAIPSCRLFAGSGRALEYWPEEAADYFLPRLQRHS